MIRVLLRAIAIGGGIGWIMDRVLRARRGSRPTDPIRSMVEIDAPIERVWSTLVDVEGQPRWMTDLKAVRLLTPGRIGVGTRAEGEIRIFGIGVLDPITITTFEPPRRFAIRHEGRFSGQGVITLEPGVDGGTTIVRWEETIEPPWLPDLIGAILGHLLGRVFQDDLYQLRELVEADSGA